MPRYTSANGQRPLTSKPCNRSLPMVLTVKAARDSQIARSTSRALLADLLASSTCQCLGDCVRRFQCEAPPRTKPELMARVEALFRQPALRQGLCEALFRDYNAKGITHFLAKQGVKHTKLGRSKAALVRGVSVIVAAEISVETGPSAEEAPAVSSSSAPCLALVPWTPRPARGPGKVESSTSPPHLAVVPWSARPLRPRFHKLWKGMAKKVRREKRVTRSAAIVSELRKGIAEGFSVDEIRQRAAWAAGCSLTKGHAAIFFDRKLLRLTSLPGRHDGRRVRFRLGAPSTPPSSSAGFRAGRDVHPRPNLQGTAPKEVGEVRGVHPRPGL